MTKHTNEKLVVSSGAIYTVRGVSIAKMDRDSRCTIPVERDANARRIVQIWNAWPDVMALLGDLLLNRAHYELSDEVIAQIKSVLDELPIEVCCIMIERR